MKLCMASGAPQHPPHRPTRPPGPRAWHRTHRMRRCWVHPRVRVGRLSVRISRSSGVHTVSSGLVGTSALRDAALLAESASVRNRVGQAGLPH